MRWFIGTTEVLRPYRILFSRIVWRLAILGVVVGGMELKDLGTGSSPRNPLLFGTFFRMSLVEQVGSGFKRIRDALQEAGQPEPQVKANEHWFSVTFVRIEQESNQKGSPTGSQETSNHG